MLRTTHRTSQLLAAAVISYIITSPLLAVPPHSSEGECADYVVDQYNKDGDEEGLKFGLQDCNDAYATVDDEEEMETSPLNFEHLRAGSSRRTGTLVLLPPYGDEVPQSLSGGGSSGDTGGSPSEPRRR
jgi:hypothetical protein